MMAVVSLLIRTGAARSPNIVPQWRRSASSPVTSVCKAQLSQMRHIRNGDRKNYDECEKAPDAVVTSVEEQERHKRFVTNRMEEE